MLVGNGPVDEFLAHVATLDDFDTEAYRTRRKSCR